MLLTHAFELLLELCLVLTVGDPKVVIWVCALIHSIGWGCSSNGHDGSWALCPLGLAYGFNAHHLLSFWSPHVPLVVEMESCELSWCGGVLVLVSMHPSFAIYIVIEGMKGRYERCSWGSWVSRAWPNDRGYPPHVTNKRFSWYRRGMLRCHKTTPSAGTNALYLTVQSGIRIPVWSNKGWGVTLFPICFVLKRRSYL